MVSETLVLFCRANPGIKEMLKGDELTPGERERLVEALAALEKKEGA